MNARMQLIVKTSPESFFTPAKAGKIQRKQKGENEQDEYCPKCRKGLLNLQRSYTNTAEPSSVPPIVHEVLNSPGQPLDPQTRAFMEPRFGHDFSNIRVHTDTRAAESARAVNALAYTVGRNLVFDQGHYSPHTATGRHLLAHELTHSVQQNHKHLASPSLHIENASSDTEREGVEVADAILNGYAPNVISRDMSLARQTPAPAPGVQPPSPPPPKTPADLTSPKTPVKTGSFNVAMIPFNTGVSGTIAFDPDPKNCPVCSAIRLVQIVRVFEKPGVEYKWPGSEGPREKVKTAEDKTKGVKAGYFVDHQAANCSKGNKCSLYYRDHWANPSESQDGSNDGTTAKKASLWDRPSGDADDVFEFETCARCHNSGAYLRCVDWGFTADSAGKVTLSTTSEHPSPTATFNAAIAAFNSYYANPK